MSNMSNMSFEVNSDAIISGIINGEIQARMCCKAKNPNDSANYRKELQKFKDAGIVNSTPSVVAFMKTHPSVFKNPKLVSYQNGNIFEEMITLAPLGKTGEYDEKLKTRMTIGHDLTTEEMEGMDGFLQDFHSLENEPDVKAIIGETREYRKSIERLWKRNERDILAHVHSILGYVPEKQGTVNAYIMYPNYDTHRSCQASGSKTSFFLGKRGEGTENVILAHLAHQAVHQPMLPYKLSMSSSEKEKFHGFIKFLTDKEIYSTLSGESGLRITTPKENHTLMGKIYPYWLGYRFRNARKQGLEPAEEIEKRIAEDRAYFEALPAGSKQRKAYAAYEFDKLDAGKIADFFRYKKGMTPYEFVKLDFDNRDAVCQDSVVEQRVASSGTDRDI